jgi:PAS domain S-box-containing protein
MMQNMADRLEEQSKYLWAIDSVSTAIGSALTTDELLKMALERTVEVTRATAGAIYFPADGVWTLSVWHNLPEIIRTERATLDQHGPALQLVRERGGAAAWTERLDEPGRYISPASKQAGIQSWAAALLTSGEDVFGLLILYSREYDAFGSMQLELLKVIGQFLGLALANTFAHARAYLQVDTQLQHRVAELEAVLASMSDGLIICDEEGTIVRANAAAARILGCAVTDLLGQSVLTEQWNRSPDSPEGDPHKGPLAKAILEGQESVKCPIEVRVDGQTRVLSVSASPVRRAGGIRRGAVAVIRDITDERLADQMKEEFLGILSHELRAPLTVISGYAQVLGRRLRQKELAEEAAYCDLIKEHSRRMASMVGDLVDSGRLESGLLPIEKTPTDMVALVQSVAERVTKDMLGTNHNITLHVEVAPDLPSVMADARRIDQVLTNLLTNAIKYSPDGGRIEVNVTHADIQCNGGQTPQTPSVIVSVIDQGIGIPPEERSRVFERAFRGKQARAISAQGLGLGLYISKLIVEAHGGRIGVEEGPGGVGSRFWFTLPVAGGSPSRNTDLQADELSAAGAV